MKSTNSLQYVRPGGNLLLALLGCWVLSCAQANLEKPAQTEDNQNAKTNKSRIVIEKKHIQDALDTGGAVLLVKVISAEVALAGTRSEQVRIQAKVERTLSGTFGDAIEMRRYTSGKHPVLKAGHRYLVVVDRNRRLAPALGLLDFIEVTVENEQELVAAHEAIIKELKP